MKCLSFLKLAISIIFFMQSAFVSNAHAGTLVPCPGAMSWGNCNTNTHTSMCMRTAALVGDDNYAFSHCIEKPKTPAAAAPKPKPPAAAPTKPATAAPSQNACANDPTKCATEANCAASNGDWDPSRNICQPGKCPDGSVTIEGSPNKCKCFANPDVVVDRGSLTQLCPVNCIAEDNYVFDSRSKSCVCKSGFKEEVDADGVTSCVAGAGKKGNADQFVNNKIARCLDDIEEKVSSCKSSASSAAQKCDAKKATQAQSGEDSNSGITAFQGLLSGIAGFQQMKKAGSGAVQNCVNIAVASSTGYYVLEAFKDKCDAEVNSCKSTCEDAKEAAASKEQAYIKCRSDAYNDAICTAAFPQDMTEAQFNVEFDNANKASFDSQFAALEEDAEEGSETCSSGSVVMNQQEMDKFLVDMNNSVKTANQCACQLSPGQQSSDKNCLQLPGPRECTINPNLPGCIEATVNCLSLSDVSQRCVCFKEPNGEACKKFALTNPFRIQGPGVPSAFAGAPGIAGLPNGGSGKSGAPPADVGDLSAINEGTGTASAAAKVAGDSSSPFAGTSAGGGGGGFGGGGSGGGDSGSASGAGDEGESKSGIKGLFNTAKSAIGNLFGSPTKKEGLEIKYGSGKVDKNNSNVDPSKWRPKGGVRGVAGGGNGDGDDQVIGSKYTDIWKVMNKQYKVQDQKDSFYFGGEKN